MPTKPKILKERGLFVITPDIKSQTLKKKLKKLKPKEGFCISIDISDSTLMKKKEDMKEDSADLTKDKWIIRFQNSFNFAESVAEKDEDGFGLEFIKGIGDEWMFFCPLSSNQNSGIVIKLLERLKEMIELTVKENSKVLTNNQEKTDKTFAQHKCVIGCCNTQAFKITFAKFHVKKYTIFSKDYYGLDIDRTFRIAGEAKKHCEPNTIIFEQEFFDKLERELKTHNGKNPSRNSRDIYDLLKSRVSHDSGGQNQYQWEVLGPCPVRIKDFGIQKVYYITMKVSDL